MGSTFVSDTEPRNLPVTASKPSKPRTTNPRQGRLQWVQPCGSVASDPESFPSAIAASESGRIRRSPSHHCFTVAATVFLLIHKRVNAALPSLPLLPSTQWTVPFIVNIGIHCRRCTSQPFGWKPRNGHTRVLGSETLTRLSPSIFYHTPLDLRCWRASPYSVRSEDPQ